MGPDFYFSTVFNTVKDSASFRNLYYVLKFKTRWPMSRMLCGKALQVKSTAEQRSSCSFSLAVKSVV